MDDWSKKLVSAINQASAEQDVFNIIAASASELGFDHCAYGLSLPLPLTSPKVFLISNYPGEWQEIYAKERYLQIDPTVAHGRRSQNPLVWSDTVFKGTEEFWDSARSFGLKIGWAQSCFDRHGSVGMMTFSREATPMTQRELDFQEPRMRWLANVGHQAFSRLVSRRLKLEPDVPLTAREVETLRWLADGKTSSDVAEILCLAVDTVNFHLKQAMVKLGAANRTAAVVRAAMLGLLS